ncbi:MAG: hypothetical protein RBU23_02585 [Candidatus Auribacterota bacterium]|jgi:hypothetical protein|nr:hypothetical protein [Candidatus Auribacterota bacterium]
MKHVFTVLIVSGVLCALTCLVYAQSATTFTIYAESSGSQELTTVLPLDNDGRQLTDNLKFVTAKAYLSVTEATTGKWYLTIYTSNPVHSVVNPDGTNSSLLNYDQGDALIWKYRNSVLYGFSSQTVGDTISDSGWDSYKYMYNVSGGQGAAGIYPTHTIRSWASVVHYLDGYPNNPSTRIQLLFGIDLASANKSGKYETTLNFEVLVVP